MSAASQNQNFTIEQSGVAAANDADDVMLPMGPSDIKCALVVAEDASYSVYWGIANWHNNAVNINNAFGGE